MIDIKFFQNEQIFHVEASATKIPIPGEMIVIEHSDCSKSYYLVEKISVKGKYNLDVHVK